MADNRKAALSFLLGKGLTRAQAAGVVGSLMQESGLRTDAVNPSSGATGIAQWLGGRKTNLQARGNPGSLTSQLNFLWSELQGPEKAALTRLKGAHTVADAAAAFTWGFERPGKAEANMPNRIKQGQTALKLAGGVEPSDASDGGGTTTSSETHLSFDPAQVTQQAALTLPARRLPQVTAPVAPDLTGRTDPGQDLYKTPQTVSAPKERWNVGAALEAMTTLAGGGQKKATTTTETSDTGDTTTSDGVTPLGGSKNAGKGGFKIDGPQPERLQKSLTKFADKVADVYGGTLVGKDGSSHSKYTTTGNVSEHYTGNATDIFTAGGKNLKANQDQLLRVGRAALIAAGMPRAKALKAPFGLYNVGNHQIIFGTNSPALGGDHTDHLHISTHA